jgi:hypothetical protein
MRIALVRVGASPHASLVMTRNRLRALAALAGLVAVALIAMPALGVDPSGSPSSAPSTEPSTAASTAPSAAASVAPSAVASASPAAPAPAPAASAQASEPDEDQDGDNGSKPDKAAKPGKNSEAPEHPVKLTGIVAQPVGEDEFTLVVGIKVYRLSVGPPWWWGDASPLAAVKGKVVTIDGEQEDGSDEVDVLAIDGKAVREPGRPPWAGGWKVVGPKHPGWAQWKVDKLEGKGSGKPKAAKPGNPNEPDESEAPEASPGS